MQKQRTRKWRRKERAAKGAGRCAVRQLGEWKEEGWGRGACYGGWIKAGLIESVGRAALARAGRPARYTAWRVLP